jgi:hypothetical protein
MAQDRRTRCAEMRSKGVVGCLFEMPNAIFQQDKLRFAQQDTCKRKRAAICCGQIAATFGQGSIEAADPVHQSAQPGGLGSFFELGL